MMKILDILNRELELAKQVVYLYEEEGKWYAYGGSAVRISELLKGLVKVDQVRYDALVKLKMVEVDLTTLIDHLDKMAYSIVSCSDMELVLRGNDCQMAC